MTHKIEELNKVIKEKASELGLIFVNGPGPENVGFVVSRNGRHHRDITNGQEREVYLFAVAEG